MSPACQDFLRNTSLSRRDVLRAGSLGLLGLTLPHYLQGRTNASPAIGGSFGRARSCILLFMWGGPAQQETWDLKPDAPVEIRGEFNPIDTCVPGIRISEHFPRLATRADRLAIVRSMTHNNVDHTVATHFLLTGQPPLPARDPRDDWPHYGAVLARMGRGRGALPPFVSMRPTVPGEVPRFVEESRGQFAGWLGQGYDPLTIDDDPNNPGYRVGDFTLPEEVNVRRFANRRALLGQVDSQSPRWQSGAPGAMAGHYERAYEMLRSAATGSAFDLTEEPDEVRDRYGRNPHGQSVLQARRLVERGVPLVTVYWPNDGIKNVSVYWDTHSRNFIDLRERLMPVADQAFSTLLDDLADRGLLDETLIAWTGEFGRTPRIGQRNSDAGAGADGRDHWPGCFSSVLAGGGIRGGQVYGSSDRHAAYPASNPVAPLDLAATIYHCLGITPETALADSQGRPHFICPGRPITALIA
jgi:hypothetical protein